MLMIGKSVFAPSLALVLLAGTTPSLAQSGSQDFERQVSPLLGKYCSGCHGGKAAIAGVHLDLKTELDAREIASRENDFWSRVADRVASKQMPPEQSPRKPTDAERSLLVSWITKHLLTANGEPDPGPSFVHRLNNRQYANSVRDLLYLPDSYNAATDFPPDERGDGFDNNASTLTISPLLIESYLGAVEKAVVAALSLDPKLQGKDATLASKSKLNDPSSGLRVDFANRQEKILLNMEAFAPRAFRRPVSRQEIDELMKFAALSFAHAGSLSTKRRRWRSGPH